MQLELIFNFLFTNWQIVTVFFFIALFYSSVGFGGGSSYLAVLTLTTLAFTQIRSTALICNIVVVVGNVYIYQKNKLIDWKKTAPIVICSIPMAFIGGYLKINQSFFYILLALTLIIAAVLMWVSKKPNTAQKQLSTTKNIAYGSFIGFLSGIVGIGGGIFLAPLLHLTNWSTSKKIAATASLFILVNSVSGLFGQILNPNFTINWNITAVLLISVFIGGQIGSRFSNKILSAKQLKKGTAVLIVFIGFRILLKHVF